MTLTNKSRVFLGLGGNLGQPIDRFREARQTFQRHPQIQQVLSSPVYRTPAVGGPAQQPDYLNAVLELQTDLPPEQVLQICQHLEKEAGRTREIHWGPRTLDIDILLFDDLISTKESLTLPHPLLHERHFVLIPLKTLAPKLCHPVLGKDVTTMLAELPPEPRIAMILETW